MVAIFAYVIALWYELPKWFRSNWRRFALLGVVLWFIGCVAVGCSPYDVKAPSVTPPPPIDNREFMKKACPDCMKFEAPPFFLRWWQHAEACTGLRGRMDKITWLLAPKPFLRLPDDPNWYIGMYWPDQGTIVLGLFREVDSVTVIHESIHAILDQNGVRDPNDQHPKVEFDEKCGKLLGRG